MLKDAVNIDDLLNIAPYGVFIIDLSGKIIFASKMAATRLKKTAKEMIGTTLTDYFPIDISEKRRLKGIDAVNSGISQSIEDKVGDRWYFSKIIPIKDKYEKIISLAIFSDDITERKRTEEDLQKSEEQFRDLYDNAPVGYFEYDLRGNITRVNHTELKMLGYTAEEMIGQPCWEFIDDEFARAQIMDKLAGIRPPAVGLERTYRRKDGTTFPVLFEDRLLLDEYGHITGIRTAIQDITELKLREESLKEKETLLNHSQEIAFMGSFIWDLRNDSLAWSKNMYSIHGLDEMPFVGNLTDVSNQLIHPEDRERIRAEIEKMIEDSRVCSMEFRIVRPDGKERVMRSSGEFVLDEAGIPVKCYGVHQDITEHHQMQEKIRHVSNELLRASRMAMVGGWSVDLKTGEHEWSEVTRKIHEVGPDFIPDFQKAISFYKEGKNRQKITDAVTRCIEKGESYDVDVKLVTASGKECWVRTMGTAEFHDGQCVRLYGTFQDINERLRMEQALRDSEQMYRTTFDAIPDSITVTRQKDGRYKYVNDGFCNITGYSRVEVIGKTPFEINLYVNHSDRERMIQTLRQNRELLNFEIPFRRKNGTIWDSFFSARSIIIDGEDCLIALTKDVTEFKKAEEEKARLERQLQQAQKTESIGSLAGGIAHDFNNLLFPIVGLSEMMLNDFPPDSMESQNIREIHTAGTRGRELVQQILSFSRQSDYQLMPVHIQKILKEVLKLCRATIPADITIAQDIMADCAPVMADPTQIHQIAMNLITNAYHAVEPAGGTITLKIKEVDFKQEDDPSVHLASGRYAVLTVTDTGMGIDPAVIDKIFDPYFSTKEKGRGTGLGLATVYGIVKAHGGNIRVYSDIGKGATFHVYLPVLEKIQEHEPEKEIIPLPTGTEHILLVDDEKPIVHLEKQMLERLGYCITSFSSSVDALTAFKTDPSRFDLVITDMNMPHMNGMQLAKELNATKSDIPVIICTGFSERINKENAAAKGIKGLLMKPMVMKDLAQKVREVLDTMKE